MFQLRDNRPNVGSRDCWGLFGGFIEPNEEPAHAVVREIREELTVPLDCARLVPVQAVETSTGLRIYVFQYRLGDELRHAFLNEGQTFELLTPEEIRRGSFQGKGIVPDHVAILQAYWQFANLDSR
jgi:8-oxo-dGTP pyrophosphatase MutT (NUDIX family)